jgi:hypothetical protein
MTRRTGGYYVEEVIEGNTIREVLDHGAVRQNDLVAR